MDFERAWKAALRTRKELVRSSDESNSGRGATEEREQFHPSVGDSPRDRSLNVGEEGDTDDSELNEEEMKKTRSASSSSTRRHKSRRAISSESEGESITSTSPEPKSAAASVTPATRRISLGAASGARGESRRRSAAEEDDSGNGVRPAIHVDGIGQLTTSEVYKSLSQIGPQTIVRFEYNGENEPIVIYWIDMDGKRHHGYQHTASSWTHQELTNAGHAFAIYRKRDNKLIASYRVVAALADGQAHVVSLPSPLSSKIENIIVEARVIAELPFTPEFPSRREWTVSYSFSVPPLPIPNKPDFFETNTIYVWGDLSFDEYPFYDTEEEWRKLKRVHAYKMNQIVPQVMCGECLCGSDPNTFLPSWKTFPGWVAQAQHYYQTEEGEETGSRAVCGRYFDVSPGERMRTTIRFDGRAMHIRIASEDRPSEFSEIVSENPFPSDTSIFPGGWAELFRKKERESTQTFKAFPCFNIEYKAQSADLAILESLCPLKIHDMQLPGFSVREGRDLAGIMNVRGMNFLPKAKPMVEFS